MWPRLFNFAALLSTAVLVLLLFVWADAERIYPKRHTVSPSDDFHLCIRANGTNSLLQVYNDEAFGPYADGMYMAFLVPNAPKYSGFGYTAGIFYRQIKYHNGHRDWALYMNMAYPLLSASLLPLSWTFWKFRLRRQARRRVALSHCPACNY
jgi:hypothetical protein